MGIEQNSHYLFLLTIIGNTELPKQEWPEPEKQTTGMSWMDKLIDLMP